MTSRIETLSCNTIQQEQIAKEKTTQLEEID